MCRCPAQVVRQPLRNGIYQHRWRLQLVEESVESNSKLFERVLRGLSVQAFDALVNWGIRDLDAFLHLNPATISGAVPNVISDLSSAQEMARQCLISKTALTPKQEGGHRPSDPVEPVRESEVVVDVPGAQSIEVRDERLLFQLVLDSLSTRARTALLHNWIRDMTSFLGLDAEHLRAFPNCGAKSTHEILQLQGQVASWIKVRSAERKALDPAGLSAWLAQEDRPIAHPQAALSRLHGFERVRRRFLQSQSFAPTPVERDIDDPASWSMLRHTVIALSQLSPEAEDAAWNAASHRPLSMLHLSDAEWKKLTAAGIFADDRFDVLLPLTIGYLVQLRIARESFTAIVGAISELLEACVGSFPPVAGLELASENAMVDDSEVVDIRRFRLDSFDLPEEMIEGLSEMGVSTWGELTSITERGILSSASSACLDAYNRIRLVWRAKAHARRADDRVSGLPAECYVSFKQMAQAFIDLVVKSPREETILLGRLGLLEGRRWTLEELGSLVGLTRERVRQIEQKRFKVLKSPRKIWKLARLWLAAEETLRISGGVCLLGEMSEQIAAKLEWDQRPDDEALCSLLELLGHVTVDRQAGLVYDPAHTCVGCQTVISALEALFAEDKSERPLSDVTAHLLACCAEREECGKVYRSLSISEGFVHFATRKTEDVLADDGVVYCRDTWGGRHSSKVRLVERLVQDAGRPMPLSEIHREVKMLLPNDKRATRCNVRRWLGTTGNILLWNDDTYVHRHSVSIPHSLVAEITDWFVSGFADDTLVVSVNDASRIFQERLSAAGIASDSALYSCLRIDASDQLICPHYPYVVMNSLSAEQQVVALKLSQFVFEEWGWVRDSKVRRYAALELGCEGESFTTIFRSAPDIVHASKQTCIHIRHLRIDPQGIQSLLARTQQLAAIAGHVSVEKVFVDKQVTCVTLRIDTPEMLYAVLRCCAGDRLLFPYYPRILSRGHNSRSPLVEDIADYIATKRAPCSLEEIQHRFVEELGYSSASIARAVACPDVLRFSRGCYVHADVIAWSSEKQNRLLEQSQRAHSRSLRDGRCFTLLSSLLEHYDLPELANGVVWTPTLLGDVLTQSGHYRVLGSAFVPIGNKRGIRTFEDLCYALLRERYDGACSLASFEHDLRNEGIIHGRLKPSMLGDQEKVCTSGHLIMLRELHDRA